MSSRIKPLIGILISILLVYYLLNKIEFSTVVETLKTFNLYFIAVLSIVFVFGMIIRALRWQCLIKYKKEISLNIIFRANSIGYMMNNLLPAKAGELVRMEYLKRKTATGRSFLLGTIFIERLLDVLLVVLIFAISLVFSQTGRDVFMDNKEMFFLVLIVFAISIFFMLRPGNIISLVSIMPLKIRNKLEEIIKSFSDSIKFINNPVFFFKVVSYSIMIWGLTLLTSYIILLGLDVSLPFYGYFFLVAVGVFGLVIPSTSGNIGVYHAIATAALALLGVAPEKALAYAIIAHAMDFFPNIALGLLVSLYEGFSMKSLSILNSAKNK